MLRSCLDWLLGKRGAALVLRFDDRAGRWSNHARGPLHVLLARRFERVTGSPTRAVEQYRGEADVLHSSVGRRLDAVVLRKGVVRHPTPAFALWSGFNEELTSSTWSERREGWMGRGAIERLLGVHDTDEFSIQHRLLSESRQIDLRDALSLRPSSFEGGRLLGASEEVSPDLVGQDAVSLAGSEDWELALRRHERVVALLKFGALLELPRFGALDAFENRPDQLLWLVEAGGSLLLHVPPTPRERLDTLRAAFRLLRDHRDQLVLAADDAGSLLDLARRLRRPTRLHLWTEAGEEAGPSLARLRDRLGSGWSVSVGAPRELAPPVEVGAAAASQEVASESLGPDASDSPALLGADLLDWRLGNDLGQRAAAERLGVRQPTISRAENKADKPLGSKLGAALAGELVEKR